MLSETIIIIMIAFNTLNFIKMIHREIYKITFLYYFHLILATNLGGRFTSHIGEGNAIPFIIAINGFAIQPSIFIALI